MKNKIRILLIFVFLVLVSLYYGTSIKDAVLSFNDKIIITYDNIKNSIKDSVSRFFNQAKQIQTLREENQKLQENAILTSTFANQLNLLLSDKNSTAYSPKISLVRAISYVQISDYYRIWLDAHFDQNTNKGLIYQGYTAGIALMQNDRAMGILQGDERCVFAVYIGQDKIPGVVQGENHKVIVDFIPKSQKINIGDEVFTSGLDQIFFSGIPVGKITKILDKNMYQSAEIEPFAKIDVPAYLYMVESF